MTYLPNEIFKNILAYCDDRIERKQKKITEKIVSDIFMLNQYKVSIISVNNDKSKDDLLKDFIIDALHKIMLDYFVDEPENLDTIHIRNMGFDNIFLDSYDDDDEYLIDFNL